MQDNEHIVKAHGEAAEVRHVGSHHSILPFVIL